MLQVPLENQIADNIASSPRKGLRCLDKITGPARFEQPAEHRTRPAAEIGNILR
jgi:hypothetical protein